MAAKRASRVVKKSGGRRGRGLAAGANTVVEVPITRDRDVPATWPSGGEPRDTVVMPPFGAGSRAVGGGLPVRGRGNVVEINKLLSELQKTLARAVHARHTDALIGLVTHAEKLLAVATYIAPESMGGVLRVYRRKLMPISEAMYARCGTKRVIPGNE